MYKKKKEGTENKRKKVIREQAVEKENKLDEGKVLLFVNAPFQNIYNYKV